MTTPHLPSTIEHLATDALIPYARNSRTHSPEQVAQLARSIENFGFTNPVLIDEHNTLIAGHGRVMAAQRLGLAVVPAIRLLHLSDAQRRAYVIADNKLALNAGWDMAALAREVEDLQEVDFDLDLLGFGEDELADLLGEFGTEEARQGAGGNGDEDAAPEPPVVPTSATGDVWLLGKHRVMCGDSTSRSALLTLTGGGLVDMWLTDPPYNVAYEGKTKDALTIQNDCMADGEFRQFLVDCYRAANDVMRNGAVFYIWHADSEGYNFRGAAQDAGWKVRQCLIWAKSVLVMGRQDYHWKHEPCLYGWKDGAAHYWAADRKQTTVLEFDKPSRNGEHPTMKPVALFEYQMLNNTKSGDVVLDSFGGSGTTLIAAEKNRRLARIMELDPKYVDVIVKRWQDYTGQVATLEGDGRTFAQVAAERGQAVEA